MLQILAHMDAPFAIAIIGVAVAISVPTCFYFANRVSARRLQLRQAELDRDVKTVQAKGALTRVE